jgi:cobalt-precorrin-5B (C1)-methyltransferase
MGRWRPTAVTGRYPTCRDVKRARSLRRGWTTGTCATAAAQAVAAALLSGVFPDPLEVTLPRGVRAAFALAERTRGDARVTAGIMRDAGDDLGVTHGTLVRATVSHWPPGSGIRYWAGPGAGTIARPGLVLPPGEPAINPAPFQVIRRPEPRLPRDMAYLPIWWLRSPFQAENSWRSTR